MEWIWWKMKWSNHREIAGYIARDIGLNQESMIKGSVYPDQVGNQRDRNPYGISFKHPHHKDDAQRVKSLMERLRRERLKGQVDSFYLGALTHLIADRWVSSASHFKSKAFEEAVAKEKIDKGWVSDSDVYDGTILNVIPYKYPFQHSNPNISPGAALKGGFVDSMTSVRSIMASPDPPKLYREYYRESEDSIRDHGTFNLLYWILTFLHPLFILSLILNFNSISKSDQVLMYTMAKSNTLRNLGIGFLGIFLALVYNPLLWMCILPIIGQILTIKWNIRDEIKNNVEWYTW